ncbi:MAG: DNA polymerase III subunit delta [Akkermansiaceae bacterium]|nr:DNA polymerase III subunit delta [Akkermansiaceae bacterium]
MPAKSVQTGSFFAIVGSDEGLVREQSLALYNELTGGNDDGFTHETIDGTADNSDAAYEICSSAVQALQTVPMFGGDKVVWLRNVNFLADNVTGRSQRTEEGVERLRASIEEGLPDGVKLIISALGVDKRRAFWKFLQKQAEVQAYDRIDTNREGWQEQVAQLVEGRAAELDLKFDPEALEIFVLLAGEQSQQISNELEKLDLYLGNGRAGGSSDDRRTITLEDVDALVPLSREAVVFEIGKAIQTGHAERAIELVDQQLEADESAIGIMRASIIGVVRSLFAARLITSQLKISARSYQQFAGAINKLPENERAWLPQKKDGGVSVYPIFLALPHAAYFRLEDLRELLEATLEADRALVTTGLDHRLILHRLIVQIASARQPKRS